MAPTQNLRHRSQSLFFHGCVACEHECRRTIVQARGVSSGHRTLFAEVWAQFGHVLQRGVLTYMLIGIERERRDADIALDRHDLLLNSNLTYGITSNQAVPNCKVLLIDTVGEHLVGKGRVTTRRNK